MSEAWETGICGCCDVKDCGVGCCCKNYCGSPCIFGAAMEKADLGGCFPCCLAFSCCSCCVLVQARQAVSKKYGIAEGCCTSILMTCCCPSCSYFQLVNQILVKENYTWGCCSVEVGGTKMGGAPETATMER